MENVEKILSQNVDLSLSLSTLFLSPLSLSLALPASLRAQALERARMPARCAAAAPSLRRCPAMLAAWP